MITPDNYWESDLDRLKKLAWYPITTRRRSPPEASKFSGTPLLYSDERWPVCPGCRRPMHHMLQISSEDLPAEAKKVFGEGYLQVFFCIDADYGCRVSETTYEPFSKGYVVRIINQEFGDLVPAKPMTVGKPFPELAIVGWRPQSDYPSWDDAKLNGIDQDYATAERVGAAGFPRDGDKLLGWPSWQQGADYPSCPECEAPMRYILQIDSEDNVPYMFGDVGTAHVTQCEEHKDVMTLTWSGG